MATTERPPSRIDGKPNQAYTKWYRAQKFATLEEQTIAAPVSEELREAGEWKPVEPASFFADPPEAPAFITGIDEWIEDTASEDFQSAAEPEQTNSDDPREPEVAPALETPSGVIEITVDRIARNKSFVYGDLNGELVPIRVKKKTGPKLVGKPIPVLVTSEAGRTLYTHAP